MLRNFQIKSPHTHIETSPLIYSANQWTGFYMIRPTVMKELNTDWGSSEQGSK